MNQPTDAFAQQTRRLVSQLQRQRDWAGGDPGRLDAVADALVELTAHRLSGHLWAEAAAGSQEAVMLAAKLLGRHGPVGPYTPRADAVRSITALVQLALVQSAAGLHPQAEQALAAAFGLREQLSRLDLDAALAPRTVAWALLVWARTALAAGDPAAANARADAALGVAVDDEWVAIDLSRAGSDARWAAGHPAPAVEYALEAVERYEAVAADLLERPDRLPAAMLERLSEPLFGLYADAADRVLAIGAPGLALGLRRRLVDLLGSQTGRRPESQQLLVSALADLADDLAGLGRDAEAADVSALASSIAGDTEADALPRRRRARLGARTPWTPLAPDEAFGVQPRPEPSGRLAALRGPADADEQARRAVTETTLARRAAEAASQAAAQVEEAERRRQQELLRADELAERQRREEAEAAERDRADRQRKRAERIAEHERQLERERAEAEAALRARVSDETDAERAEREELERLAAELAEIDEPAAQPVVPVVAPVETPVSPIEPVETPGEPIETPVSPVEPVETPVSPVEPVETPGEPIETPVSPVEPVETPVSPVEPVETPGEPIETPVSPVEPVETPVSPVELVETPEPPVELVETPGELVETPGEPVETPVEPVETSAESAGAAEPDALDQVRSSVEDAAATGKRREVRAATEALAGELRQRYQAEPERYLDEFLEALDQLSTARWQAGDWWGSRGPSKEAKNLRKQHGR
ncbi:MAG: hypothetical protein QM711_07260 [Micropruina sp.]|uniref:hypothetical protein n=1 Tax=Micropruina sp. TaxID=2737536 RepID=UPI0039E2C79C